MEKLFQAYMEKAVTFAIGLDEKELKKGAKSAHFVNCQPAKGQELPEGIVKDIFNTACRAELADRLACETGKGKKLSEQAAAAAFKARKVLDVDAAKEAAKEARDAANAEKYASILANDGRNLLSIDAQRAKLNADAARGDAAAAKVDRDRMLANLSPTAIKAAKKAGQAQNAPVA